ncbi:MAG: hypothetical protein M1374_04510 [Firmicutes bacterium]|nr:hypothetical protein [Bacillota bacterium]
MTPEQAKLTIRSRIRAFISLPGRVISLEEKTVNLNDRLQPIEGRVLSHLDGMREELAEMKVLIRSQAEQDIETSALIGSLIKNMRDRIDFIQETIGQNHQNGSTLPPEKTHPQ